MARRALIVTATVITAVAALPSATAHADTAVSLPSGGTSVMIGVGGITSTGGSSAEQCGANVYSYGSVSLAACIGDYYSRTDSRWEIYAAGQMSFFNTGPQQWNSCTIDVELYIDGAFSSYEHHDCTQAALDNTGNTVEFGNSPVVPLQGTHTYQSVTDWWGYYANNYVQSSGLARSPVLTWTGQ